MRVKVTHDIGDLAADLRYIAKTARRDMGRVVRKNATEGNRIAKAHASEQHTMFGDTDIEYPPSFTTQKTGPLEWEYGPDSAIGDGSQSPGYEHGSRNSPPHNDLARSFDVIQIEFGLDVEDMTREWFWPER